MCSRGVELSQAIQSGIQQAIDALRSAACEGLDMNQLTGILKVAFTERNRFDASVSGLIGAVDGLAEEDPEGRQRMALSCASWLDLNLQMGSSAAFAQVHLARQLPGLPTTAAAFERGELSSLHVSAIVRTVEEVRRGGGEDEDVEEAEFRMLQQASQHDPRSLRRVGLSLLHEYCPRELEVEEARQRDNRYFYMAQAPDGGFNLTGYLDPVAGVTLKTAINGVLGPRRKDDLRDPGQRRADGLTEIATRVLDRGDLPVRGGQRPHITLTATLATLRADPGAPAALLDWGIPVSGRILRQIAGDAELTPILLSAGGDPLHVGRKYRTATRKMRKALAERDRHCVWPGCIWPPEWTEGHHARLPWALGGKTDVDEMASVCEGHHGKLNEGWRLERLPDRQWVAHPPERPGPVYGPAVYEPPPSDSPGP